MTTHFPITQTLIPKFKIHPTVALLTPPKPDNSPVAAAMVSTLEMLSQHEAEEDKNDENIVLEVEEESEELDYELTREKRIKENMERMKKLGIFDMSLQLKSAVLGSKTGRKRRAVDFNNTPVRNADVGVRSTRRSARLQNTAPVSYAEEGVKKEGNSKRSRNMYLEVGSKEEAYTEEHDKLLGECNMSWTLFVDGYGKDGKRIYDPVKGKTCHQCRQKTLGHRTTCCECNLVQGQFCGDCLYMRYGENVLEANQNPDWVCPPCRGICNCSLCRQAKGWAPTGPLYRKISSLGYKSVAHYLFQTRRSQTDDGNDLTKTLSEGVLPISNETPSVKEKYLNSGDETEVKMNAVQGNMDTGHKESDVGVKIAETEQKTSLATLVDENDLATKTFIADVVKGSFGVESIDYSNTPNKTSTKRRRPVVVAPSPDSIAGRLRLRRKGLSF